MRGLELLLVGVPIYLFPVNLMSITGEGLVSKNLFTFGLEICANWCILYLISLNMTELSVYVTGKTIT